MSFDSILQFVIERGTWVLFLLVAIENIGIPGYPGGWMLVAIGILVRKGLLSFARGFLIAMAASISIMVLIYLLSYKFGNLCTKLFAKNQKFISSYERMQKLTQKYGSISIVVLRIIPVLRTFVSIIAGMLMMPFRKYIVYSIIGNSVFTIVSMSFGYFAAGAIA